MNNGIKYLTEHSFRIVCEILDKFFENIPDPSPDFSATNYENLDMIINSPRQTFGGIDLYPDLFDKAACYIYFVNKFHPFNNGNKRVSIVATDVFLSLNGYDLIVEDHQMYSFAKEIAQSQRDQREDLKYIATFLKRNCVPAKT